MSPSALLHGERWRWGHIADSPHTARWFAVIQDQAAGRWSLSRVVGGREIGMQLGGILRYTRVS